MNADRFSGPLAVREHGITALGKLLLKEVGAEVEDAGLPRSGPDRRDDTSAADTKTGAGH